MFINNARLDFDGDIVELDDIIKGRDAGKTLMVIRADGNEAMVVMTKEQMLDLALELNQRAMAL